MDQKINIRDFFIVSIIGTLGHFLYDLTSNNKFIGYFFPTSESTWEHLKLLFFPAILIILIQFSKAKEKYKNFFSASFFAILCGMLSIVTIFYTYRGILGFNLDFINILTYYIGVIIFIKKRNSFLINEKFASKNSKILALLFCIIFIFAFFFRSYHPSETGIFAPPNSIAK